MTPCMKDFPSWPSDRIAAIKHKVISYFGEIPGKFQYLLPKTIVFVIYLVTIRLVDNTVFRVYHKILPNTFTILLYLFIILTLRIRTRTLSSSHIILDLFSERVSDILQNNILTERS